MYNQELKERFIEEFSTSVSRRIAAVRLFNTLEPLEEEWGTDICTVDKERLQPVINGMAGLRERSLVRVFLLRDYCQWCLKNDVDSASDAILKIEYLDLGMNKVKREMVANPQHLQRYLNCICAKEEEETADCWIRCLCWLIYGGMRDVEDAMKVTDSDVDFTSMVVTYNDMEYPIYREAIPAFKKCVNLKHFKIKHPNHKEVTFVERANSDLLLRGKVGTKERSVNKASSSFYKKKRQAEFITERDRGDECLNLNPSFYSIWLSGLFYRMYEAERSGMPADFTPVVKRSMESKTYKLDSGRNLIGAKQRQLVREYLSDYGRWKEAYSYGANHKREKPRNSQIITIDGITRPLIEWCEEYGISYSAVYARIRKGRAPIDALTAPVKDKKFVITIDGVSRPLTEWCDEYNIPNRVAWERIHRYGWDPIDALTKPINENYSHPRKKQ